MGCIILGDPRNDCTKQYKNLLYQKTKPARSCSKNSGMEINQGKITQFEINLFLLVISSAENLVYSKLSTRLVWTILIQCAA